MKRFFHIDVLRAAGILAVIAIHVLSDNLTSPLTNFIWNYLHFIIVAFIFCSGYVMYAFYAPKLTTVATVFSWYKKRLIRLLLPFYWYLLAHFSLMLLFPKFFSGLGLQFNLKFIVQSITLVGGINLNWLPLLFLQLAVLFPLLVLLWKKQKIIFWLYCLVVFFITVGFSIWQFPYSHYRAVMWIPWSLFLVLPWYFVEREKQSTVIKKYMLLSLGGFVGFLSLFIIWKHVGRSVTLIDNKYPPNFFYIFYEMFGSFLILTFAKIQLLQRKYIGNFIEFLSRSSYALFFIHYIVFDFIFTINKLFLWHLSVWYELLFVFLVSCIVAFVLAKVQNVFHEVSFFRFLVG